MKRTILSAVAGIALALSSVAPATAAEPHLVYQQVKLSPFINSRTYVLTGRPSATGCTYAYPAIEIPDGIDHWQVRDVAVDPDECVKLVEEGVPTAAESPGAAMASTTLPLGAEGQAATAATAASGYAHAWFENVFGQSLTSDTTYLTWAYSGGCVTSSSSYGDWSWNYGYGWGLVSNNGSRSQSCAQVTATTWSTFRNGSCYEYYYSVTAVGKSNGGFTGSRSDSATCGPIWEHFDYQKTT